LVEGMNLVKNKNVGIQFSVQGHIFVYLRIVHVMLG